MDDSEDIPGTAVLTGLGDTMAGLLGGLAIFPAVFAFGLQPDSGPSLIFFTLPQTFQQIPLGGLFGLLFFAGLFGAAFLSAVAALEVLVGGIVDNTVLQRKAAVFLACSIVLVLAIPPMINMKIFFPWDLTFGSGMQTLGAFLSVATTAWCIKRSEALKQLASATAQPFHHVLYWWMRVVIPACVLFVGMRSLQALSASDIDDVRVRRRHRDCSYRPGRLVVEDGLPDMSVIRRLPHSTVHVADVEHVWLFGHTGCRLAPPPAEWPDHPPPHLVEEAWIVLLGIRCCGVD